MYGTSVIPKDILVLEYAHTRRLVHVLLRVENRSGVLMSCMRVLEESGANVLTGFHSARPLDEVGVWSFLADLTVASVGEAELERGLRGATGVREVSMNVSRDGLIVDKLHFPPQWNDGRPIVTFRRDVFAFMLSSLIARFGSAAKYFLYKMGEEIAICEVQELRDLLGREKLLELGSEVIYLMQAASIGRPEIVSLDLEHGAVIRVYDNFECSFAPRDEGEARSHLVRGQIGISFKDSLKPRWTSRRYVA